MYEISLAVHNFFSKKEKKNKKRGIGIWNTYNKILQAPD